MIILKYFKQNKYFVFLSSILLLGMVCRFFVIWNWNIVRMLSTYISDDMFYYLKIASNIAQNHGVRFDGRNITNGFHPLYMVILVSFFKFIPHFSTHAIRITLSFLACIQIITAYFLYKISSLFIKNKFAILIGTFFFVFHPFNFFAGLSGIEAPLATFFLCLSMYWYLGMYSKKNVSRQKLISLGALFGLSFMARTSAIFMIFGILIDYCFHKMLIQKSKLYTVFCDFMYLGITMFSVIAPWFLWSIAACRTIFQDSMNAIKFWSTHITALIPTLSQKQGLPLKKKIIWMIETAYQIFFDFNIVFLLVLFLVPLLFWILHWFKKRNAGIAQISLFYTTSLMTVMLWGFYFCHLGHIQHWYFLSSFLCASLFISISFFIIFEFFKNTFMRYSIKTFAVLILIYAFLLQGNSIIRYGFYPWHKGHLKMAKIINQKVPQNEFVGSFNAGIYSAFSGRTVTNLDGVANHSILPFLKNGGLLQYLEQENIRYIVDYQDFTDFIPNDRKIILWQENTPIMGTIILFKLVSE